MTAMHDGIHCSGGDHRMYIRFRGEFWDTALFIVILHIKHSHTTKWRAAYVMH